MFIYTRAAINKTIAELKAFTRGFSILLQMFYIAYLVYAVATPSGNTAIDSILLALSVFYFIFYITTLKDGTKTTVNIKHVMRRSYKYLTLGLRAFTLGVAIYSIYIGATTSVISLILSIIMIITFLIQLLIEVLVYYIEVKKELFSVAVDADIERLNPFSSFSKGKDESEPDHAVRAKNVLDKYIAEQNAEREEKKKAYRDAKRREILLKRSKKQTEKAEKKKKDNIEVVIE